MIKKVQEQAEEEATIIDTYIANKNTYILLPVRAIAYYSIVLEKESIYYVKQTPLEIIKHSCLKLGLTTYEARRKVIAEEFSLRYKTPIVLSQLEEIFVFPTASSTHQECCWIFKHKDILIGKTANKGALFINREKQINLDISHHTLKTQFERAFKLRYILFPNSFYFKPLKTL